MHRSSVVLALVACGAPAPSPSPPGTTATEQTVDSGWARGAGCTPMGPEIDIAGKLVARPLGKGSDGAILITADGEWILSYRIDGVMVDLVNQQVVVRGRACTKEGEAVGGKHFDARAIRPAAP